MSTPTLILASRSPRRVELLRDAGYVFTIDPADIDEDDVPTGLKPAELAVFLASTKARHVAKRRPGAVVLGADTVVAVGSALYGKAETPAAARDMLIALGGQRQDVITGIALVGGDEEQSQAVRSIVQMRAMTDAELDAYVASEQWRGKAGAYGIQDHDPAADPFVKIVEGDYTNVVGLPMEAVRQLLATRDIHPLNPHDPRVFPPHSPLPTPDSK